MMDSILEFFTTMVPEIGIFGTVFLVIFAVLVTFIVSMMNKKEKLMNKVIDEQSKYSQQTAEAMKVAITEIKELSIMSMNEVRGLSSQISSFVDLATALLVNNQRDKNNKTSPPDGGDGV